MTITLPPELSEFSTQEIQFELMRRSGGTGFDPYRIIAFLQDLSDLWHAAIKDRIFVTPQSAERRIYLPLLYKLRDIPYNYWNADSLFVLAKDRTSAEFLADRGADIHLWDRRYGVTLYTEEDTAEMMPNTSNPGCVFKVWWD